MELLRLQDTFFRIFGNEQVTPETFFAPGRVNLIGEHTDYNGGYVLPCALSFGTTLLIRRNNTETVRFASTNFEFKTGVFINDLSVKIGSEWVNYPLGVINQFISKGAAIPGFDMLFSGDIPNGAGLSSSASIELVTAVALDHFLETAIDRVELVKMSRAAENDFVGMNCGIMDQFVVGMGKAGSALFLNCRSLDYELVPAEMEGYSIVISNTNKRRELADSKYNERVSECTSALYELRNAGPLADLSDMSLDEFDRNQHLVTDATIRRRARHVISENERVLDAVKALKSGDLSTFGKLMNQSHRSLKEDYEVTGFELDTIVSLAQGVDGVLGARMTGAGFGGCSVAIVKNDRIDAFRSFVGSEYTRLTGLVPEFYVAAVGNGAGRIA